MRKAGEERASKAVQDEVEELKKERTALLGRLKRVRLPARLPACLLAAAGGRRQEREGGGVLHVGRRWHEVNRRP